MTVDWYRYESAGSRGGFEGVTGQVVARGFPVTCLDFPRIRGE